MLASDLNNTEFVGAQNPDSLLHVEFYWCEPIDKWSSEVESQKAGKNVVVKLPKQPFVRIMRPGDQTSIWETSVREEHKRRWPDKWLYWQMSEGLIDGGENIPGFKIEEWDYLKDKTQLLKELKFAQFHTVELLAGASDAQIQKLGIGGLGLRENAKQAMRDRMSNEVREQLASKDKEISEMKAMMAQMQESLSSLTATQPVIEHVSGTEVKRRGRPKGSKNKPKTKE